MSCFGMTTVSIELTKRCNLRCSFCYANATPRGRHLAPARYRLLIREATRLGLTGLHLTGGEPFCHPDIMEFISLAREVHAIVISTNGTLVGPSEARMLSALGTDVMVSLDGPEPLHDQLRGVAGAYREATRGLGYMLEAGVPTGVQTVVTSGHLETIEAWATELVRDYPIRVLSLSAVASNGRGRLAKELHLDDTEKQAMVDMARRITEQHHFRVRTRVSLNSRQQVMAYYTRNALARCLTPWVTTDGTVFPFIGCSRSELGARTLTESQSMVADSPLLAAIVGLAWEKATTQSLTNMDEALAEALGGGPRPCSSTGA